MDTQEQNPDSWTTTDSIEVAQMDDLVQKYRLLKETHEEAKKQAAEIYHKLEEAETQVINALTATGKSKYFVDGIGTVFVAQRVSYKTPKTLEDKLKLFAYIEKNHGKDALMNYLSIHSQSLNSFANKELEADPTKVIDGLETPTITTELRFRRD